ncbi:MAG TPA: type II toxin-antitoxin system HipA family toxin [Actinomycetota bacterium]|nr:type II toxin-antitoxin system HipA family toxin [Actinomycetota bacterium]
MSEPLVLVTEGMRAGTLTQSRSGTPTLTYEDDYQRHQDATPLSVSMPLALKEHHGKSVQNWLSNLLPDNVGVLDRWATQFHVSAGSPFSLLRHVGRDVAGAFQFVPESELGDLADGGIDWLDNALLVERLAELKLDPAAWTPQVAAGMFSLSGAQPKIALRREGERWGLPFGSQATTHILKPYWDGLPGHAVNEHLSLRLAARVGLPAAQSEIQSIGDATVIIIRRYDRVAHDDQTVRRVHQEDLCQALSLPPSKKYETDGGPGITSIVNMLRSNLSVASAQNAVSRVLEAQALAWAMAATDAHAKNYSLLLAQGSVVLAPLYDLSSAAPYFVNEMRNVRSGEVSIHRAGLAMKVAKHRRFDEITGQDWASLAEQLGLHPDEVMSLVATVVQRVPTTTDEVVELFVQQPGRTGSEVEFALRYKKAVMSRAALTIQSLEGRGFPTRRA